GMTAATLNELSGGRVFLGLGTSGRAVIENFHGVKYEHPLDRVRECVSIIRQVTTGATLNHHGPTFTLKHFKLACKLSHGAVPVYLAALGPRMLRLAGEIADGALLLLHPRSYLPEALRFIEEGLTASGRRWENFDVAYMTPFAVSEDSATARSEVKKHVAFYVGAMGDYYYRLLQRTKFSRDAEEIKAAWKRGDKDVMNAGVSDELADEVGAVGTVEDCHKTIGKFHAARVNTVVLDISPMRTLGAAATAKGLESLAPTAPS
ncbi:MAG: LLM class flavin-dependent oxidoreductase, partial [Candidatus Bathyarchaeia archaeon]